MVFSESAIPSKNRAFVLSGVRSTSFEERAVPDEVADDEVIVCPKKTGLCGSDVHYVVHGSIGPYKVEKPMILGHESSGVIAKVGRGVKSVKVGDRVAIEPGASCRACHSCKEGHYERCPDMKFAATPPFDGTLQSFYVVPGDLCYPLPDSVSLEEGALVEPLSVAVMAVSMVGQMPHCANVAVFGAGPVGLLAMAVAKAQGARRVLAIDIQKDRLDFAKKYAATDIWASSKMKDGEDRMDYSSRQAEEIKKDFGFEERGPGGIDLVVDCTGAEICIQTGIFLAKHGGTCVQVGMGADKATIPISTLLNKEISLKGSFRYGPGCYVRSIDLVSRGLVDLKSLITHRFSFEEADEAIASNEKQKGPDGKVLIKCVIDGPDA